MAERSFFQIYCIIKRNFFQFLLKGVIKMRMKRVKNLWEVTVNNLKFYTESINGAIAIAWELGGRK
jgi:hypothetical protein|uniref:Uncharacterized protein n=1 Tax=Siphoviridae sp. ctkTz2 TaxID=2827923 RepID=A0A8S5S6W9_9CAUD|nr:MAG TPA: hypothetical protein [Siphoviridae sp. ctkTz2]